MPANFAPTDQEFDRLRALYTFNVLDTAPEPCFDKLAELASEICETPIALISLVDEGRQWFKARFGLEASETPRCDAFCAHAIQTPTRTMIVADAAADPRFAANPLVIGGPKIRFYAGAPLVTSDGQAIGTLCVIGRSPRSLDARQRAALRALATVVMRFLERRRRPPTQH